MSPRITKVLLEVANSSQNRNGSNLMIFLKNIKIK